MLKQLYRLIAALLIGATIAGCTSDLPSGNQVTEGDVPVQLNGMLRALGDDSDPGDGQLITTGHPLEAYQNGGVQFYLSARTVGEEPATYFLNQKITVGKKNDSEQGRNKLDGNVYYPLGKANIDLISYTGEEATNNGVITLIAGTGIKNDYLLGKGTEADGSTLKSGNSDDPIEFITYKHLMTRVDVRIEVDNTVEDTKPQNVTMRFQRSGNTTPITNKGTYNIFSGGNAVSSPSADYSFSEIKTEPKTHYLVPNGTNLTTYANQIISYLKIDDYVATADDLKALKFSKAKLASGEEVDFILSPGLAYDLVFKINRLKITEIKVTVKNWDTKSGSTEWGYEPKKMALSTDNTEYDGSDITKMVLKYKHTDDKTYQYIGEVAENNISFVTLPQNLSLPGTTLTADLYTKDGLLADNVTIEPSNGELKALHLGQYGMKIKTGNIYEISTPLQLALLINEGATQGRKYEIVKSLDMHNTSLQLTTSKSFPTEAVLDGNGNEILHFNIRGNGLFLENNGTLKNFRIASGTVKGNASIAGTNNGTIEAVFNQADIAVAGGTAGGIVVTNGANGKILATVNAGNVLGSANTVGGIAGENKNVSGGAITACLNVGLLNKGAGTLGGIIGNSIDGSNSSIVNTCFWLTGTARKNQAISNELAIGNNPANGSDDVSADLAASVIRSEDIIEKLNNQLTDWGYQMDKDISSWPIAKKNP